MVTRFQKAMVQSQVRFGRSFWEALEQRRKSFGGFGDAKPGQVQQGFGEGSEALVQRQARFSQGKVTERRRIIHWGRFRRPGRLCYTARPGSTGCGRRFRRRLGRRFIHWGRFQVQQSLWTKFWRRSGDTGAEPEPVQFQQGFGEGCRRSGAKPAQVDRGFK